MKTRLPFPLDLILTALWVALAATAGSYAWEFAEPTGFFGGEYGFSRRVIWTLFSGLLCAIGIGRLIHICIRKIHAMGWAS